MVAEGTRDAPRSARLLAWASGLLLVAGAVSAGSVAIRDARPDGAVVSAAGRTVDVTPTVTVTLPPPAAQPPVSSTVRTTTTLPKAAVAVLRAIATTTTTQPGPATTATTTPPTTTPSTSPTTTPPTTVFPPTTLPTKATVTLANQHTRAFVVTVNGQAFTLGPSQVLAPVDLTPAADGNDRIDVHAEADPSCALSETSDFFQPGSRYRVSVAVGPATCGGGLASPDIDVTTL